MWLLYAEDKCVIQLVRAASAVAAEYHDTTLGGVTDGSTKFNITPKKLRWTSEWCNGKLYFVGVNSFLYARRLGRERCLSWV